MLPSAVSVALQARAASKATPRRVETAVETRPGASLPISSHPTLLKSALRRIGQEEIVPGTPADFRKKSRRGARSQTFPEKKNRSAAVRSGLRAVTRRRRNVLLQSAISRRLRAPSLHVLRLPVEVRPATCKFLTAPGGLCDLRTPSLRSGKTITPGSK